MKRERPILRQERDDRAIRILQKRREAFLRQVEGRKVHRVDLPPFIDGQNKNRGDDIYDVARELLAAAPEQWPDGASPFDVLETYAYRKGLPEGSLSMYGIIGELVQWRVKETKHGNPTFKLVRSRSAPEEWA